MRLGILNNKEGEPKMKEGVTTVGKADKMDIKLKKGPGQPIPDRQDHDRNNQKAGKKVFTEKRRENSQTRWNTPNKSQMKKEDQSNVPASERKFTQRCRLFIGNLTNDTTEDELRKMFQKYGEVSELYLNADKGFAFVRLDLRRNAELAKAELDGVTRCGRTLRVRFATHGAALKVKHLSHQVSNELLERAFSQFGDVERAVVIVDDRGRSTGEGIVEFGRKFGAVNATQSINEGCFLLTTSLRPIMVEPLEQKDEDDGLPEKNMSKTKGFDREREHPPRFTSKGTFEHEYASRWKQLYEMEQTQKENLEKQVKEAREKLQNEMIAAQQDHETMLIRQDLARRQEELRRIEDARNKQNERMRQQRNMDMDRSRGGSMNFGNMNMMGGMGSQQMGGSGGSGGGMGNMFGNNTGGSTSSPGGMMLSSLMPQSMGGASSSATTTSSRMMGSMGGGPGGGGGGNNMGNMKMSQGNAGMMGNPRSSMSGNMGPGIMGNYASAGGGGGMGQNMMGGMGGTGSSAANMMNTMGGNMGMMGLGDTGRGMLGGPGNNMQTSMNLMEGMTSNGGTGLMGSMVSGISGVNPMAGNMGGVDNNSTANLITKSLMGGGMNMPGAGGGNMPGMLPGHGAMGIGGPMSGGMHGPMSGGMPGGMPGGIRMGGPSGFVPGPGGMGPPRPDRMFGNGGPDLKRRRF